MPILGKNPQVILILSGAAKLDGRPQVDHSSHRPRHGHLPNTPLQAFPTLETHEADFTAAETDRRTGRARENSFLVVFFAMCPELLFECNVHTHFMIWGREYIVSMVISDPVARLTR